jgi:hypothetical protein
MAIKDVGNVWTKIEKGILTRNWHKWIDDRDAGKDTITLKELDLKILREIKTKTGKKRTLDGIRAARSKYGLVLYPKRKKYGKKAKKRKPRDGSVKVGLPENGYSDLSGVFANPEQEAAFSFFAYSIGKTRVVCLRDLIDYALREFYRGR